jgi:curli biogenesis system outer membrane secretion channel CsgG
VKRTLVIFGMTGLLAATACSTSGTGTATTTSKPNSARSASEVPWSLAKARTEYIALVGPTQKTSAELNGLPATASLSETTALVSQLADQEHTALVGFKNGNWPTAVRTELQKMISVGSAEEELLRSLAQDTTLAQFSSDLKANEGKLVAAHDESNAVRRVLGLPPAP